MAQTSVWTIALTKAHYDWAMTSRAERIGRNEALFREVNERIEDVTETLGNEPERLQLLCECGSPSCTERITLARNEYEALRGDAQLFAVYPGHEDATVERVAERRNGYDVVRKHTGEPERIAEETDPRP
jgi:hypothetical protein